jgi:hypothetical protein
MKRVNIVLLMSTKRGRRLYQKVEQQSGKVKILPDENSIQKRLKEIVESLKYGELVIKYTIHDSKIVKGEVIERVESLG